MEWVGVKRGLCVMVAAALASGAWAQSDGKISDSERAKRDAEKVFSFIKFHTVKPAAAPAPAKPAPTAAKPAPAPAPRPSSGGSQVASAAPAASPTPAASEATLTRSLVPAAPPPQAAVQAAAPASVNTLPPAASNTLPPAASMPAAAAPEPEPEPETEEVPLKLEQYVAPEMTRQVLEAIGGRDHVVPVRFTVEANGVVSKAEPREGANRRLGLAASRAVQQWRFGPLPERRVVDVELLFRANNE